MSRLSDLLNSLRGDWSTRRIAQEATSHGHNLSFSTVSKYMRGEHAVEPAAETLEALAVALDVDVNLLREAADLDPVGEPFELGAEARRLSPAQRDAIRHLVWVLLNDTAAAPAPPAHDGGHAVAEPMNYGLAAMSGRSDIDRLDREADRAGEESQDPDDE